MYVSEPEVEKDGYKRVSGVVADHTGSVHFVAYGTHELLIGNSCLIAENAYYGERQLTVYGRSPIDSRREEKDRLSESL